MENIQLSMPWTTGGQCIRELEKQNKVDKFVFTEKVGLQFLVLLVNHRSHWKHWTEAYLIHNLKAQVWEFS